MIQAIDRARHQHHWSTVVNSSTTPVPLSQLSAPIPSCPRMEIRCQVEQRCFKHLSPLMDAFERSISVCQPRETRNSDSQETSNTSQHNHLPFCANTLKRYNTRVTLIPWWTVPEELLGQDGLQSPGSVSEPWKNPAAILGICIVAPQHLLVWLQPQQEQHKP